MEIVSEMTRNIGDAARESNDAGKEMESKVDTCPTPGLTKISYFPVAPIENRQIDSPENRSVDSFKNSNDAVSSTTFKKPTVSIGSKRCRPTAQISNTSPIPEISRSENVDASSDHSTHESQEQPKDPPFPYVEPPWGGKPEGNYKMEVLKSGVILETIPLSEQSFHVIGRLPTCHLSLAHRTISRSHAVLQYRSKADRENSKGFYVYDFGSTHGTFWNGSRIKPNVYVRVQGGHMLRFGCSQRKYILQAPPADQEEESQYTLSELKEMRSLELEKRRSSNEAEASGKEKQSEGGIDWGMGEDADEDTDLQENPYACIADDDLVLEDPKKTLRGWFEREGYDLQYQTEEKGIGQFLCWVNLPMDDVVGRSIQAEALVKGKKKEAVVQCALEACKILDKYGLLRQANHEGRKRKTRNWEAEDYYDSDEDNFLDRTGSIERKREQRMRQAGKLEEKVETYDSLLDKHKEVAKRISSLSDSIKTWQNTNYAKQEAPEEDALDAFMLTLSSSALTKSDIAKMKLELQNLRKEEMDLVKLLNLTRPANLPPLTCQDVITDQTTHRVQTKTTPVQRTSLDASRLQDTVLRRTRKRHAIHRSDPKNSTSTESLDTGIVEEMEAEYEEESDSDDENEKNEKNEKSDKVDKDKKDEMVLNSSSRDSSAADKQSFESKHSSGSKNKFSRASDRQQKHDVKVSKKSRQERHRISCDQDVYTDNYSTWVPPQNQIGDGKTSLNEKYGY